VLQILNNLIAKLQIAAEYFKAFVEMITGVDSSAQSSTASVSSLGNSATNTGNAVKKASKTIKNSLAGFDQLNVLSKSASNSLDNIAGTSGIDKINSAIDTSGIDNLKGKLDGFKKTLSEVWESFKSTFGEPLKTLWTSVSALGNTVFNGVKDSAIKVGKSLTADLKPIVQWFIDKGFPMMCAAGADVADALTVIFKAGKTAFDTLWADVIDPFLKNYAARTKTALDGVYNLWSDNRVSIKQLLSNVFADITLGWANFWNQFNLVLRDRLKEFNQKWGDSFKDLTRAAQECFTGLTKWVSYVYTNFISPMSKNMQGVFAPAFVTTFNGIAKTVIAAFTSMIKIATSWLDTMGNSSKFMLGVFTGNWKLAWSGIKGIFDTIVGNIKYSWKGLINTLIDYFNWFTNQLNTKLSVVIPSWLPPNLGVLSGLAGKHIGFNIPKIPKLATGGIVDSPTLAMIGEKGKEAVVPLENTGFVNAIANSVASAVQSAFVSALQSTGTKNSNNNQMPGTLILKIGETEFAKLVLQSLSNSQKQVAAILKI
jgi:hypothetical protein